MADTLMYLKRLEDAGFSRKQAEAQVELMRDYSNELLATKQDLKDLRMETKSEFKELRAEMNSRFGEARADTNAKFADVSSRFNDVQHEFRLVRQEIAQMADKITIRVGGMMVVCMGLLAAFLKLA